MNTEPRALGTHLFFFRNGAAYTVPSAGTCSKTTKPGAADPAWVNLGSIIDVQVEKQSQKIEMWGPSPGQIRRLKVIETKKALDLMFTCQELGNLALEAMFGTGPLANNTAQWNPLEGSEIEGWIKGQVYDHKDAQFIVLDHWVCLTVEGSTRIDAGDGALTTVRLKAWGLHSTLNTGSKPTS
jgi:hypothetical protein